MKLTTLTVGNLTLLALFLLMGSLLAARSTAPAAENRPKVAAPKAEQPKSLQPPKSEVAEGRDKKARALDDLVALGETLTDRSDYDLALRAFSCAFDLGEDSPSVMFHIAYCHGELGEQDAAAEWYAKAAAAVEKRPQGQAALMPKLYSNYGATLVEMGKPQDALAWYQKAVQADPKYAPVYFNLGLLYEKHMDRPEDAIEAYRRHVALGGDRGIAARNAILSLQEKQGGEKGRKPEPPIGVSK